MQVLKRPIITEKASEKNEAGVYGFVVDKRANKIEIKKAVESKYGVTVEGVRTAILPGKPKSRYTKTNFISGHSASFKKAYVTLVEGDVIDLYENA
ncbi:50S ribosomal protein L23 [Rapidithrix thailandica]|uniref:Large ribosomal subunit protein uL23 n=1 Tax=Rapidithrix thailandica TaxID=413964 RepID=A0AAW9S3V8_9BACT